MEAGLWFKWLKSLEIISAGIRKYQNTVGMKLDTEEVYHLVTKPGSKILVFKETECIITYFENFKKKQFTLLIMSSGQGVV